MTPERWRGGVGRAVPAPSGARTSVWRLLPVTLLLALSLVACGDGSGQLDSPEPATITVDSLHERLQSPEEPPLLVDVRTPQEFEELHIEGARLAPFSTVVDDLQDVPKDQEIVLVCVIGARSEKAQRLLAAQGYTNLRNMEGGMRAWTRRGYPVSKTH